MSTSEDSRAETVEINDDIIRKNETKLIEQLRKCGNLPQNN